MRHPSRRFCFAITIISLLCLFAPQSNDAQAVRHGQANWMSASRIQKKSYAENIERIKEYQRKNSELFNEELKELLKTYGELGVDALQHLGPDRVKDAVTKVKGVYDVTKSAYSTAGGRASGNKSLALANALEGL